MSHRNGGLFDYQWPHFIFVVSAILSIILVVSAILLSIIFEDVSVVDSMNFDESIDVTVVPVFFSSLHAEVNAAIATTNINFFMIIIFNL